MSGENSGYCFPDTTKWGPCRRVANLLNRLISTWLPGRMRTVTPWMKLPVLCEKIYYVNGINSQKTFNRLTEEKPDVVITFSCGVLSKRLCENFHNVFLNAHAGKLPEFRGMNNVEWAYLEDKPLVGTIHFMSGDIDAGDIVYENEISKITVPTRIGDIREHAFDYVYGMFPKALRLLDQDDFKPIRQNKRERTTRYVMNAFLKNILEKKLTAPR